MPGRLLHHLRRTAITNLVGAGVSEGVAIVMCGHKTRAIFDRYNVTSEKDIRGAAVLLTAHLHSAHGASTFRTTVRRCNEHGVRTRYSPPYSAQSSPTPHKEYL